MYLYTGLYIFMILCNLNLQLQKSELEFLTVFISSLINRDGDGSGDTLHLRTK